MGHTLFYITDGYEQMMKYALETYLKQTQNNSVNQNIETTGNIEVSISKCNVFISTPDRNRF